MRLCLYQPDIPQNVGASIRLAACFNTALDIIEPCGFPLSDKAVKRAAMDYESQSDVTLHPSWSRFCAQKPVSSRLVLLTTQATQDHTQFQYQPADILLLGRESAGVPQEVHDAVQERVKIPLAPGARSLNVTMAGAIVLAEAMRQTGGFERLISAGVARAGDKS